MKQLIKQVHLETGYRYEDDLVLGTTIAPFDILIEDGRFSKIEPTIEVTSDMQVMEAHGQLMLPSFREMHIHIDKTYFGGDWKAPTAITKGILTRIEEEQNLLPKQLPFAKDRAIKMVEHLIANGHTHIRSHCNVDPQIGTKHIDITMEVLASFKDKITYDIVAFPQHGLIRSEVEPLMREAMEKGATHVGGVDPAIVDRAIHKSLELMIQIASDFDKHIDIHLHDRDTLGEHEFHVMMDLLEKHNFKNEVTISHAIALSDLQGSSLEKLTKRLASFNIDVTTTVPIGQNRSTIPIPYLYENGVHVSVGHDSLTDHWSPFGTGNTIQKLNVLAERFKFIDEYQLSQSLKYATGGITPLNAHGEQVWPKVGQTANALLVDAVSAAHTIARICPITTVISNGSIIYEDNIELKGAYR